MLRSLESRCEQEVASYVKQIAQVKEEIGQVTKELRKSQQTAASEAAAAAGARPDLVALQEQWKRESVPPSEQIKCLVKLLDQARPTQALIQEYNVLMSGLGAATPVL